MGKELKIRITDYPAVEKKLLALGAAFAEEQRVTDTYYNQPEGKVLKITDSAEGSFFVRLEARNGGFEIVENKRLEKPGEEKERLASEFGVKAVLRKTMRFFKLGEFTININLVPLVGDFLILTGENPAKAFIEKTLEFKNPEYITVSFDQLKKS